MMEENEKKGIWIKIIVLSFIIFAILGIYLYKNILEKQENSFVQEEIVESEIEEIEEVVEKTEDMSTLEITEVDLEEMISSGVPFVIDFGSDSCIPCKEMAPVLEILYEEFQGKARIHFVDVWKNQSAAVAFPVSVIPTQIFYYADGTPFVPSDALAEEMEFLFYSSPTTNEHLFTTHQGGVTEEQLRKIFLEMGVE
jgi:thioredoxin 1